MSQLPDFTWSPTWFENFSPIREPPSNDLLEEHGSEMMGATPAPGIFEYTTELSQHSSAVLPSSSQRPSGTMDPPIAKRAKKAPTLNAAAWASQKEHVLQLHIEEGRPLREVREIMDRDFGFVATERQYRTRLTQWGEDKKVKPAEMQAIVRKRQYRLIEETDKQPYHSEVRRKLVTEQQIGRWMKRNGVSENMLYHVSPAASTPSDVRCLTISAQTTPVQTPTLPMSILTSPRDAQHYISSQASQTLDSPTLSEVVCTPRTPFLGQSPAPISLDGLGSFDVATPSPPQSLHEAFSTHGSNDSVRDLFVYYTDVDVETISACDFLDTIRLRASVTPRSAAVAEKLLVNETSQLELYGYHGSVIHVQTLMRLAGVQDRQGRSQTCKATLRTCLSCITHDPRLGRIAIPFLLYRIGAQYLDQCRLARSADALNRSLNMMAHNTKDRDDLTYLNTMAKLGLAYYHQWHIEKAEHILATALDQAMTLKCYDKHLRHIFWGLWGIYHYKKRHLELEQVIVLTLDRIRAKHGSCDATVREISFCLVEGYLRTGRYGESVKVLEKIARDHVNEKGESHIETALCYQRLGDAYGLQARWSEAERYLVLAMSSITAEFGRQHRETMYTKLYLVRLYNDMKRCEEALSLGQITLDDCVLVHGPKHDLTLCLMGQLGRTYHLLNRHNDAIQLLEEMTETSLNEPTDNYFHLQQATTTLSIVYADLRRWNDIARIRSLLVQKLKEAENGFKAQPEAVQSIPTSMDGALFNTLSSRIYNWQAKVHTAA